MWVYDIKRRDFTDSTNWLKCITFEAENVKQLLISESLPTIAFILFENNKLFGYPTIFKDDYTKGNGKKPIEIQLFHKIKCIRNCFRRLYILTSFQSHLINILKAKGLLFSTNVFRSNPTESITQKQISIEEIDRIESLQEDHLLMAVAKSRMIEFLPTFFTDKVFFILPNKAIERRHDLENLLANKESHYEIFHTKDLELSLLRCLNLKPYFLRYWILKHYFPRDIINLLLEKKTFYLDQ